MEGDDNIAKLAAAMRTRSGIQHSTEAKPFRFSQDTDEYKLLEKLCKQGAVKASDRPTDVKARYECFGKINSNSFRQQFNKLKSKYGIGTRNGMFSICCRS